MIEAIGVLGILFFMWLGSGGPVGDDTHLDNSGGG